MEAKKLISPTPIAMLLTSLLFLININNTKATNGNDRHSNAIPLKEPKIKVNICSIFSTSFSVD